MLPIPDAEMQQMSIMPFPEHHRLRQSMKVAACDLGAGADFDVSDVVSWMLHVTVETARQDVKLKESYVLSER